MARSRAAPFFLLCDEGSNCVLTVSKSLVISTPEHFKTCWTQSGWWFVYALPSLNSAVWTSFRLTNPSFGSDNPGSRTKRNRLRMKLLRNFALHQMHFIFSQNLRHWQFLQSCYATLGNRHGVNLLPFKFAKHLQYQEQPLYACQLDTAKSFWFRPVLTSGYKSWNLFRRRFWSKNKYDWSQPCAEQTPRKGSFQRSNGGRCCSTTSANAIST